jgi:two-component system, NtrC family, C4-dicarboxylate transport response regulator DctD
MPDAHTTILVVEDEPHSREGLRDLLAGRGYVVETAADARQAISQVNAHRFAGAIIDLHLPPVREVTVTGWDIADICRAFTPDIAVLFVSAEGGAEVEGRAKRLGHAAFLEKPIDPARLAATLGQLGLQAQTSETP